MPGNRQWLARVERARKLADELDEFPLGHCSPSSDVEEISAYMAAYANVAIRFMAAVNRLAHAELVDELEKIGDPPDRYIEDAYRHQSRLRAIAELVREIAEDPESYSSTVSNSRFVTDEIVEALNELRLNGFDLTKLRAFCDEMNECYARGNYLSVLLLIRAVMNHVPPIFGFRTFAEVVASAPRSVKAILRQLEDDARPLGDLHTHMLIRSREAVPTINQVDPYKPAFEVLLNEVISKGA